MKQVLIFLLFFITLSVQAQIHYKSVMCGDTEAMYRALISKDFKEQPIWVGKNTENNILYTLFVNKNTKSWTIIETRKDLGCVLGSGYDFEVLDVFESIIK